MLRRVKSLGMLRNRRVQRPRKQTPLYIGEWLARLGMKPVEVARGVGISEAYLSELISNKKKDPSFSVLSDIADFMGVQIDHLRRPPPRVETVEAVSGLSPEILARLKSTRPE